MKRISALAMALLLAMLSLSGCGEKKKYEAAAALEAEGKYYEAYLAYHEIRSYEDSSQKEQEMEKAVLNAARTAFAENRYDEAAEWASYFPHDGGMTRIAEYAQTAKDGTWIKDLKLSGDGNISFTAAIGPQYGRWGETPVIQIALKSYGNGRAGGSVFTAEKQDTDEGEAYFIPEDYLTEDGQYEVTDLPLGSLIYDAKPDELTLVDFDELDDSTLGTLQTMQWAQFPIAREAIMNDGTKALTLSMWGCRGLKFRDLMKTFAGGVLSVRIVSQSGSDTVTLFEQTVDIPAE